MARTFAVDRLSLKLGVCVAVVLFAGVGVGTYAVFQRLEARIHEQSRSTATLQARTIRLALEHQMLHKDRALIRGMVSAFTDNASVQRVAILDHEGRVRHSSDRRILGRRFPKDSPSCASCHERKATHRPRIAPIPLEGGQVLRGVEPIPNKRACHGCHDPRRAINGIVLVDVPVGKTLGRLRRDLVYFAGTSVLVGALLLLGVGLVFRRFVGRRLRRLEVTSSDFAAGELDRRIPVRGHDMLARLETQFNDMADALRALLGRLREHRASLMKVMNSVTDGMVVLSPERTVVAANDAFLGRLDPALAPIIGTRCCDLRLRGGSPCVVGASGADECPTAACLRTGTVQVQLRTRRTRAGGTREEEVIASPVTAEDGTISQVVEVWRDITDRRSHEARLAETQRMVSLGMLAAGFSHEVNTPLASIGTCLEVIRAVTPGDGVADPEARRQVEEAVAIAASQVSRCGAITRQFLQLARGRSPEADIVDLGSCLESIAGLCRHTAAQAGVSVRWIAPARPVSVWANHSAVQQVLLNLLLNAIEASPKGGGIQLAVELAGTGGVTVVVADQGEGIDSEDLARVFEPFFTRRERGTGLGLFVSISLARGWGGDIVVASTLGEGATFRVLFPPPRPSGENHDEGQDTGRR